MLFSEGEQICHRLLNLRCPRFDMKTLYYNFSQVLSALSESSIEVCKFQLFHATYISFKPIFDLEFRCLSWESKAPINAVLIFYLFCLTGKAKRCCTNTSDKKTSIHKFYWSSTLRTLFVTFYNK
jgi:hypothetical protein